MMAEEYGAGAASDEETVKAAFGAENRRRLIDTYFASQPAGQVTAEKAWAHVYRLLLWTDQTNGLAHCYESDKSQPGKNWYARSLAFHDWVSTSVGISPAKLSDEIDWLFLRAASDLAREVMRNAKRIAAVAEKQMEPYKGREFPLPGEDPELVAIVRAAIGAQLVQEPTPEVWQSLIQRIRQHLALENKRKNLVGEGFEDVLAQVVRRTCKVPGMEVHARRLLHELRGFNRERRGEKKNKVDLALIRPGMRTLVTAKWSLRADREKQFMSEFREYTEAESDGQRFQYVFVTNEFDPARLMRACEKIVGNEHMFTHVVHINTEAIRATYGKAQEKTMSKVLAYIDQGRMISLAQWLKSLSA